MMTDTKLTCDNDLIEKRNYNSATALAVYVSRCLGSCAECTGFYSDDAGNFLLKCACVCHQDRHNVKKKMAVVTDRTSRQYKPSGPTKELYRDI
jgi:hypothetical protein